jgi:hypothetical protein
MKIFLALSCLLAAAFAADTCSNCKDVVGTAAAYLTSAESMATQTALLVAELCPTTEDVAKCEEGLPAFWMEIGSRLWPGYFNVDAEWTCGTRCASPTEETMDCESCQIGVNIAGDQLLSDYFTDVIVGGLGGDWYCTNPASPVEDPRCPEFVDIVIRQGLPLLWAATSTAGGISELCEMAVPGTCPPRNLRLF